MKFNTPKEILFDIAKELKKHPARWCQGSFAFDRYREPVSAAHNQAVSWCLLGHIIKRTGTRADGMRGLTYDVIEKHINAFISGWNDHPMRRVSEVIALCEKAAA